MRKSPLSSNTRLALLLIIAAAGKLRAADVTSTWSTAANGNWNVNANWTNAPALGGFPHNTNGGVATYDAVIAATGAAYTVTTGTGITLEDLTMSSANATVSHTTGTFTATNGIALSAGTFLLNGGTVGSTTINLNGTGALTASASNNNLLTGVTVNGDLTFPGTSARARIGAGTTFTTARLSGAQSEIGFLAGGTLSGTVVFEGASTSGRHVNMSTAGTFTIAPAGVIRTGTGFGGTTSIGGGNNFTGAMTLVNQGLISSQVSGRTITLQPASLTSSGTLEASNGGTLTIGPGSAWSNAGTVAIGAGSVVNLGAFNTTGGIGTFNNTGGTVNISGAVTNTGNTITLNNATGSWTLNGGSVSGGTINFADGRTLNVTADSNNLLTGVTVNGDLTFAATGARARIGAGTAFTTARLSSAQSEIGFLSGSTLTGAVVFEGASTSGRHVNMNSAGTLTIAPAGVIRTGTGFGGTTSIGGGNNFTGAMTLVNQGLISSQVSGRTITLQPASLTNTGTLEASNGGTLTIGPVSAWSNGGTVAIGAGSVVNLGAFNTTGGVGTFNNTGGTVNINGAVTNTGNTITLNNATGSWTLAGGSVSGGTINFADGRTLNVTADSNNLLTGVTVNGDLTFSATGARTRIGAGTIFTTARLSSAQSEIGFLSGSTLTGAVVFEGSSTSGRHVNMSTAGTLTIAPAGVIRTGTGFGGTTSIGGGNNFTGAMTLVNQGLISSQVSGRTITLQPASLTSSGTLEASNGGTLTIGPGSAWSNAGTVAIGAGSVVNLGAFNTTAGIGTFNNTGGTVNINGAITNTGNTITLNNATGSWTLNGGSINGGTINFADGRTLNVTADSNNLLTGVTVNGDVTFSATGARTRIGAGTTFTTARLSGAQSEIGFPAGGTLSGTVVFEGASTSGRHVNMSTPGTLTIAPGSVIRTSAGLGGNVNIGGGNNFTGAMTLVNQGLISSQTPRLLHIGAASLSNAGTIEAINGGTIVRIGGYTQSAGVSRVSGGTLTTANGGPAVGSFDINGGTLEGYGSVVGTVAVAGVLDPKTGAAGGLAINGDLSLAPTAALHITLGGTTRGTQYDFVSETGTAPLTLDGTLRLELSPAFRSTVTAADVFTVLDSNQPLAGAFDNVSSGDRLTTADGFGSFVVTYSADKVVISDFKPLFDVGPGHAYTSLGEVPWSQLLPGDEVRLHYRPAPYAEKFLMPVCGTALARVSLVGVPGPLGERPVISGLAATLAADSGFAPGDPARLLGLITIARSSTQPASFKPCHIRISGLELRDIAPTASLWTDGAAAIRLDGAEDVLIEDCVIHHVSTGISARLTVGESGLTRDLTVRRCHFHNTGVAGSNVNASLNTEAAGMTVRFCRFDPPIAGATGPNIVDRSAGTVFEANRIEGGVQMLRLQAPTGVARDLIFNDPRFSAQRIAGNLMLVTAANADPVFCGADPSDPARPRTGALTLHHNTILCTNGSAQVTVPMVAAPVTVDYRHNIARRTGATTLRLMGAAGTLNSGINWHSPGWLPSGTASLTGTAAIITNAGNDPLLSAAYVPQAGSQCLNSAASLLVSYQYVDPAAGHYRAVFGAAADLGAIEAGLIVPGPITDFTGTLQPAGFQFQITGTPNAPYAVEWTTELQSWYLLTTGTASASGTLNLTDPAAAATTAARRLYRAVR